MKNYLFGLIGLIMISCSAAHKNENERKAKDLFEQSANLILEFREKIVLSTDSIVLDSIYEDFDKRLTDINFSFPPLTDIQLTEQENDSLATLLKSLSNARLDKLKEFGKKHKTNLDSIS